MKKLLTTVLIFASLSVSAQKQQCKGITSKGVQCSRKVTTDYCFQHGKNHNGSIKSIVANKVQCSAITKKGTQCSRNAAAGKTTCAQHTN